MTRPSASPPRIDVHHHLVPPVFRAAFARRGLEKVAGAPLPDWSPERSHHVMDANGIGAALLSLSAPGVHFGDDEEASVLARACNEMAAGLGVPGETANPPPARSPSTSSPRTPPTLSTQKTHAP